MHAWPAPCLAFILMHRQNASSLKEKVTAGANGKAVTKDQYYYGVTYYIKEENTPSEWEKNTKIFEATPTSTVKIPSIQIANIKREGSLCVSENSTECGLSGKTSHPGCSVYDL